MGFAEWLLRMGIRPEQFEQLPSYVKQMYRDAYEIYYQREGDQRSKDQLEWLTQQQREEKEYQKSRRRQREEFLEEQQREYERARLADHIARTFGPTFRGGWG